MLKRLLCFLLPVLFIFSFFESIQAQEDKEHPMISRYEGSVVKGHKQINYDRIKLPSGIEEGTQLSLQIDKVEGEVSKYLYVASEGHSVFQVQKNYKLALKDAGFQIVFEGVVGEDIPNKVYSNYKPDFDLSGRNPFIGDDQNYFLARLPRKSGDIYVSAHTVLSDKFDSRPATGLQIIEEKSMPTGKVEVDITAKTMAEDIKKKGSVRIYGIYFDTDDTSVRGKSTSTLNEIASLLKEEKEHKFYVVGHTDATGDMERNMELSKRRARAVVEHLVSKYNISEDRLEPKGVGPLAPVANNEDDEARKLNRRVELVKIIE